jgi:hypothetical protein
MSGRDEPSHLVEKKPTFVASETNYKETVDEHVSDDEERKF